MKLESSDQSHAERMILTPSALNRLAHDLLEDALPSVWIEGELSNVSRPASGHLYFTLKDSTAQVRCAMFKPRSSWLGFKPTDGLHVLARARVSLYEARGEFQLIVEHLEEAGEGALQREFERLKKQLAAEGLFARERKRLIPRLPRRIGIITSATGAAVRDVLHVLARRFPLVEVEILPVPVQGKEARAAIVAMLDAAARAGRHDVLLLTRGGGSLEDLWAFNDEALARAIVRSPIPVVSAVGHEVDFSISDFVADLRAATPSAAAELLVPDRLELGQHIEHLCSRLLLRMRR
ncbi:MAG TPA: exodeoxyribonuclease VII large subunit, partial [Dokdonella sp.]|nr:exodeoxyribonuclease VII large subunit [Dokdonella sp.]